MVEANFCAEVRTVPPSDISVNRTVEEKAGKGATTCGLQSAWGSKAEGKTAGVWQKDL